MSDVSCVCTAPIIGETRRRGLDPETLIEGLGLDLGALELPSRRIPWPAFVAFAHRSNKLLGSETLEELAADATIGTLPAPLRWILPKITDSRQIFTLAPRWWGPRIFHGTRGHCERLEDGRLREIVQILPDHAPCPEFFAGLRGTLRAMPRLLGEDDALVTVDHDGREAEFIITPPPSRPRSSWIASRAARWRARSWDRATHRRSTEVEREIETLGFREEQRLESERRIEAISEQLADRERRLEIHERIGQAIACGGDVETVGERIAHVVRTELGFTGVRLTLAQEGRAPVREWISGHSTGPARCAASLTIHNRTIGLLEVWGGPVDESEIWLRNLAPWLAAALESSGSRSLVEHLMELVAEDARDWRQMERRLEELLAERGSLHEAPTDAVPADLVSAPGSGFAVIDLPMHLDLLVAGLAAASRDEAEVALSCTEGLWVGVPDGGRLESFIEGVVEIFRRCGASHIDVEAHPVSNAAEIGRLVTSAEIGLRGHDVVLDGPDRVRLREAIQRIDTGLVVVELDEWGAGDPVCVRILVPLLAGLPEGPLH